MCSHILEYGSDFCQGSELMAKHLVFPQALIQGALSRLGMAAYVTAECTLLPQCEACHLLPFTASYLSAHPKCIQGYLAAELTCNRHIPDPNSQIDPGHPSTLHTCTSPSTHGARHTCRRSLRRGL